MEKYGKIMCVTYFSEHIHESMIGQLF